LGYSWRGRGFVSYLLLLREVTSRSTVFTKWY